MSDHSQKKAHHSQKKAPSPTPLKGRATTVLRVILVAFLVLAVAVLIAREVRSRTAQASNDGSGTPTAVGDPSTPTTVDTSIPANGVVAYYFHATARCSSCITIEKWTADAIQTEFAAQLADGTLTWRVVDVQEPANAHFIQDYQLVSQSVVLVRYTNGQPGKWENLQMVWQLLGDNKAFADYITSSTRTFMEAQE
jgi:hypothetical protein